MKYTTLGHVKHIVSIEDDIDIESDSVRSYLIVKVEDTGLGIKKNDRHNLF